MAIFLQVIWELNFILAQNDCSDLLTNINQYSIKNIMGHENNYDIFLIMKIRAYKILFIVQKIIL